MPCDEQRAETAVGKECWGGGICQERIVASAQLGLRQNIESTLDRGHFGRGATSRAELEFEKEMHELVSQLKTSHTGFFHQSARRIPARFAINATFQRCQTGDGERWMFLDVHEGGPAHAAEIEPGDLLMSLDGEEIRPPVAPMFRMGEPIKIAIQKRDGTQLPSTLPIPSPKSKERPMAVPRATSFSRLADGIGLLKATMFPGAVGIDVARDITDAMRELADCTRLIIDLRGNTGGGIGGLRLMSYLTPHRLPVGYSLTKRRTDKGYDKEKLPRFGRIPSRKSALPWLVLRYAFVDKSIVVVTEGLGPQKFHGRAVILVNHHTTSAGEMIAAFAKENNLATIVGTTTAGRLLSGSIFKVGHGYILGLPVAAYLTWQGALLEGKGVSPHVEVGLPSEALKEGRDPQVEKALEFLSKGYEGGWAAKQRAVREILKRHPDWRPHIVWRRAAKLGLTRSSSERKRERAGCTWSEDDDRILLNLAGYKHAKVIAKILHRSESAVRYRLAVLGKSSRLHRDGYARRALAEDLHLGIKTVQRLIVDGLLEVRDPRITNRSLQQLGKASGRLSPTTEIPPRADGTLSELTAPSEGPQAVDAPPSSSSSAGPFPTRASRAKRFWMEAATTLGVSLETVEQYILNGVLKLCDPRITESSLHRFCRRNGSLINSDFLNPETRSWLKEVMDLASNAGKDEANRLHASRKHAQTVRKCACGRTIRGNAFFRHSRTCREASSG